MIGCSSIKNLALESNWPYEATSTAPIPETSKKVAQITDSRLPLGIKLYSPQGVVVGPGKPVLSHHFVPNTYRDDQFDQLSAIKSLGDQEGEETEYRGVDTPLYSKSRRGNRNGSQTPLSRFAATPTSLAYRKVQNGSLTPGVKSHNHLQVYGEKEKSLFERKTTLPVPAKLL